MDPETQRLAAEAVTIAAAMGRPLDYTENSISTVEAILEEISAHLGHLSDAARTLTVQRFGCYMLVVGFRAYGGRGLWHQQRAQPVLVVGDPECRIAIITWDKVRGRLSGDKSNDLVFFWKGFAERARQRTPGDEVLFVGQSC